jgi:hypothetical protein
MDSARLAFVELAGKKPSPEMDVLLQELDCVPLAIKLIAELAKTQECGSLLAQWHTQKTALLRTDSLKPGRLTSIDMSIAISLNSPMIKQYEPNITKLLSLICNLPEGVFKWENRLGKIISGIENLIPMVMQLLRNGLMC